MRLRTTLLAGVVAIAVGGAIGCGDESEDEAAPSGTQTATQEPNHEVAPPSDTTEAGVEDGGGGNGGFAKNAERNAYRDSKDLCAISSPRQIAREYGGDPSDPISVAKAYASQAYVPRFYGAAFDGCLDGLKAAR